MNSGHFDTLKVLVRCGSRPKARQIRPIALWLRPERLATQRVLEWVALVGVVCRVNVTTRSTSASVIFFWGGARARLIKQSVEASVEKPAARFADALATEPYLGACVTVGLALGTGRYETGTLSRIPGSLSPANPPHQCFSFGRAEYQGWEGSSSRHEGFL